MTCFNKPVDPETQYVIDPVTLCWNWIGYIANTGYGQIGKCTSAPRYFYEKYKGPLGKNVPDHKCKNRKCVNPEHLESVTHKINTLRGTGPTAINAAKTHCIRGHALSGYNLGIEPKTGNRYCKRCKQLRKWGQI